MIRLERRLTEPRWLSSAVPLVALIVAFVLGAVLLLFTGHAPIGTYRKLFDAAFFADDALTSTLVSSTPLVFTGLAAAFAFRVQIFNIGAEGQLYLGAVAASGVGIALDGQPSAITIPAMLLAGLVGGAFGALIPALLKAFASTNEIITTLMLNYVAAAVLDYLIFDSFSFWRDTSTPQAQQFPQGKPLVGSGIWGGLDAGSLVVPLGMLVAIFAAVGLWVLWGRTRFGFEMRVLGDSPRAAKYAGMRSRRTIVSVMCLSGGAAGLGGASQIGDFSHTLDPRSIQQAGYGYTGIVVAALARYNPFLVVLVAVLLGGLQNAGYALQGPDFPAGLVGTLQGTILFCALAAEVFGRYRLRVGRTHIDAAEATA